MDQDIFLSSVEGGDDFEPGLGLEWERGTTTSPGRVVAARLMVVTVFAALPIVEGVLVAILPLGVLGILIIRGGSRMVRFGWGGC